MGAASAAVACVELRAAVVATGPYLLVAAAASVTSWVAVESAE